MEVGRNTTWDFKKADDDDSTSSIGFGSISEDSMNTLSSSSSSLSELSSEEEAADSSKTSSSSSSSSTQTNNGPLYELSQLMNHLPIKRGLSMFYEGKAQSFTSLATVESIEDLPKKATFCRKKMKSISKSYGGDLDLDRHKAISHINTKATISKDKSSRSGSLVSPLSSRRRGTFLGASRLSIAVHKN
ncbi:protein OXIDATIVE STRESS 3-like [Prosopis cineraria]|uniref:protein OXIDATIVE STRESS 3-like n=1 Tax=Prosopis cineraria TaxID=364024 RepID=UPI00240F37FF|nr:protein OXIDATIVE STRESS 3-like [Prosopis cineraria]